MGVPAPTVMDPELGLVRYCKKCDDWWPLDSEFWYFEAGRPGAAHCKACWWETKRAADDRRKATA